MSELTRREFIRHSALIAAGIPFISCDDKNPESEIESPGQLLGNKPYKRIIIIGAGLSGFVTGYELIRAGHDVTILEARNRICLLYTSPSPRDRTRYRMPSSA